MRAPAQAICYFCKNKIPECGKIGKHSRFKMLLLDLQSSGLRGNIHFAFSKQSDNCEPPGQLPGDKPPVKLDSVTVQIGPDNRVHDTGLGKLTKVYCASR